MVFALCLLSATRFLGFFFFFSWRLITLQYCSGFCHTFTWISHGLTCIPHPDPPSHLPLYPIPLGRKQCQFSTYYEQENLHVNILKPLIINTVFKLYDSCKLPRLPVYPFWRVESNVYWMLTSVIHSWSRHQACNPGDADHPFFLSKGYTKREEIISIP